MFDVVVQVAAVAGGLAVLWWSRRPWSRYRAGRGRPVLHGIDPEAAQRQLPRWPLRATRWPDPWEPREPSMTIAQVDLYVRAARLVRDRVRLVSDILLLVGGAWIGAVIPDLGKDSAAVMADAARHDSTPVSMVLAVGWPLVAHLFPIFVVAVGYMLRLNAQSHDEASRQYEARSRQLRRAAAAAAVEPLRDAPPPRRQGVLTRVRRLLW